MRKLKIRYLVEKRQKGHSLWYWQPTRTLLAAGWLTRRLAERTNDLADAVREAEQINRELDAWRRGTKGIAAAPGSLPDIIRRYQSDEAFNKMNLTSQRHVMRRCKFIELWSERAGHPPFKTVDRKAAKQFYRALKAGTAAVPPRGKGGPVPKDPEAARLRIAGHVIGTCRVLWNYAYDEGEVQGVNPFANIGAAGFAARQQTWTEEQIEAVIATAKTTPRARPIYVEHTDTQRRAALAAELALTLPTSGARGVPGGGNRAARAAEIIGGVSEVTVRLALRRMRTDPEAHERIKAAAAELDPRGTHCSIALAVRLAANTAQRRGDILQMKWNQYDGERIRLRQGKTGAFLDIPVTEQLKADLDAAPRLSPVMLINEETGKPWTAGSFNRQLRAIMRKAGVPDDLNFHDLRRTATVRLAEAKVPPPLIAAVGGWSMTSLMKMLDIYMPRNTAMAREAITMLEEYRRTQRERKLEG
jgi:integrase